MTHPPHPCHVCGGSAELVYEAESEYAVSSVYEVHQVRLRQFFCHACGHLSTPAPKQLDRYYSDEYRIWTRSEEEDQLYRLSDAGPVYRSEHQATVLLDKLELPPGARVLDFGCAKGATARHLLARRPDIALHLFEVSTAYQRFWESLAPPERWAVHDLQPAWDGLFDVVCSFYVFEHIEALVKTVHDVRRVLKPDGVFYFVVPNLAANPGDFIVVDHVNHFSEPSLRRLLLQAGFGSIDIDKTSHDAAYVVTARACDVKSTEPELDAIAGQRALCQELAEFWGAFAGRIRQFEDAAGPEVSAAIYGAGLNGIFIYGTLRHPERIRCFLDRSPFRQGMTLFDRPVLAPDQLPTGVTHVYVGLNPQVARAAIDQIDAWRGRDLVCFYP